MPPLGDLPNPFEIFDGWAFATLPLCIALTAPLFFERPARSRRFALVSALVAATAMTDGWLRHRCHCGSWRALMTWHAVILARALWRLVARPRTLWAPPPDPPARGGPYR